MVVPRKGLEPSRPLSHWHLKPARLPIPPPGPGPVSTDRSRACQTASTPPKLLLEHDLFPKTGPTFPDHANRLYSAEWLAYRETAKYRRDLSNLTLGN